MYCGRLVAHSSKIPGSPDGVVRTVAQFASEAGRAQGKSGASTFPLPFACAGTRANAGARKASKGVTRASESAGRELTVRLVAGYADANPRPTGDWRAERAPSGHHDRFADLWHIAARLGPSASGIRASLEEHSARAHGTARAFESTLVRRPWNAMRHPNAILLSLALSACGSQGSLNARSDAMSGGGSDAAPADEAATDGTTANPSVRDGSLEGSMLADGHAEGGGDGGAGTCHSTSDCASGSYCRGVLDGPCMGTCARAASCTTDAECEAGVCRQTSPKPACSTAGGSLFCSPPCRVDADCPPQDACTSNGHCAARPCSTCPPYLSCVGGSLTGLCAAKICQSDGDCTQGYCVQGSCQGSPGVCEAMCG